MNDMGTKRKTKKEFVEDAILVHGNKYDYSKTHYINNITKICIICPIHGEFWQTPKQHLRGQGCPKCGAEKIKTSRNRKPVTDKTKREFLKKETGNGSGKFTTDVFIKFLFDKYGDQYDYTKVNYVNHKTKVCLICPEHGEFWKEPNSLLHKNTGCPECIKKRKSVYFSLGKDVFIEKANDVFHGTYSYDNVKYINNSTKVEIICKKHGPFFCTPQNHLKGRGCPICKSEKNVYENRLYTFLTTFLDENLIVKQYRPDFLTNNKSLDFFIEKYNIAIEHQGSQHFYSNCYFDDTEEKFKRRVNNDLDKIKECEENGVTLFHFTYEIKNQPVNCMYQLITSEEELKNKILNIIKNEKSNWD